MLFRSVAAFIVDGVPFSLRRAFKADGEDSGLIGVFAASAGVEEAKTRSARASSVREVMRRVSRDSMREVVGLCNGG